MNHLSKTIKVACLLASTSYLHLGAQQTTSNNSWIGRAQTSNSARTLSMDRHAWSEKSKDFFGTINAAVSYQRSFNQGKTGLGSYPLWSGTNSLSIGNNDASAGNGNYDWDAFQMGLGPATGSATLTLKPQVYQTALHLHALFGQCEMERGWFTKVSAPIGILGIDPGVSIAGTLQAQKDPNKTLYPYLVDGSGAAITTGNAAGNLQRQTYDAPYQSVQQFLRGEPVESGIEAQQTFASMPRQQIEPLQYGKLDGKRQSNTNGLGIGDVQFAVGYNVWANEQDHIGIAACGLAPTGNKVTAEYMLEPIFGYGGSWGAGAEIMGRYTIKSCERNTWQVWYTMQALHLFKARQKRSFDATKHGPGSKYLLARDFGYKNGAANTTANRHLNLINVSTLDVDVSVTMLFDAAATLIYKHNNWEFSGGYNLFGKTKEKLKLIGSIDSNRYAVIGHQPNIQAGGGNNGFVQYDAKINGSMWPSGTYASGQTEDVTTSNDYFINTQDLNIASATQPALWTSKLFGEVFYKAKDRNYCPYLGLRTEIEMSHSNNNAVHQWSLGLQTGIAL